MNGRGKINLVVDILMLLGVAFLTGTGLLNKYVLPAGREKILKYGENLQLTLLGWDRHQWGDLHLMVACFMLGLLSVHLVLHWKTILGMFGRVVPSAAVRRVLSAFMIVLALVLLLFSFIIPVEKGDVAYLHRNIRGGGQIDDERAGAERDTGAVKTDLEIKTDKKQGNAAHEDHGALNGKMTVNQAAAKCGISTSEVKRRLGLPDDVSETETLGRLRRQYGFTMREARERLEKAR